MLESCSQLYRCYDTSLKILTRNYMKLFQYLGGILTRVMKNQLWNRPTMNSGQRLSWSFASVPLKISVINKVSPTAALKTISFASWFLKQFISESELLVSHLNIFAIFWKLLTKTRTVSYEVVFKQFINRKLLYTVLLLVLFKGRFRWAW